MKFAVVILAAGASTRLGQCKALVELGGASALARLVEAASECSTPPPLVIAGAHFDALLGALPPGCELAFNPHWSSGRTSGVALARRLRAGSDLCLAPVDCPLVGRTVFAALAQAWAAHGAPARGWLAPFVELAGVRRFGHPVVVGRELAAQLERPERISSLRDLRALADPLLALPSASAAVLDDLDTPADLARLRARIAAN